MTGYIEISDNVLDLLVDYIVTFFDPNNLPEEHRLNITDEIVLAGLQEVVARRSMEREVKE